METGFEPVYTDLQSVASPLGHSTGEEPASPWQVRDPLRADDGIRTRDPHLGKVMLYQLSHVRIAPAFWGVEHLSEDEAQTPKRRRARPPAPRGRLGGPPRPFPTRGGRIVRSRWGSDSVGSRGRLAQLVARFVHTEEVISSSLVSPTTALGVLRRGRFASRDTPSPPRRGRLMRKLPHRCP